MFSNFAVLDLSTPDLIIILVIVLLLFGSRKLPELSKSIGSSMRELRKGLNGSDEDEAKGKQQNETKRDAA